MKTVSVALAASLALGAGFSARAQDATALLRRATSTMGADDLKTLRYSGAGTGASYGQAFKPDTRWPKLNVDRKSTRLNSSHLGISYAVFCLKKKKKNTTKQQHNTK